MSALLTDHGVFLLVALSTHALLGYTLGTVLGERPLVGAVGALVADLDLLFPAALGWPFVHRGVTHTLLAAAFATAVVFAVHRGAELAFGAGYASQLLVDATTPMGIPALYPLVERRLVLDFPVAGHAPGPTAALWLCCLGVLAASRYRVLVGGGTAEQSTPATGDGAAAQSRDRES